MDSPQRLIGDKPPSADELRSALGAKAHAFWMRAAAWIDAAYPGVFVPEWLNGGRKHGWLLRYKKSKSFCSFIPETHRFQLLIVFGAEERSKVEAIRPRLSVDTVRAYDEATTYHDGKWLVLPIMSETSWADAQLLLATKRKLRNRRAS